MTQRRARTVKFLVVAGSAGCRGISVAECKETSKSLSDPVHTHQCGGEHAADSHKCILPGCGRYFWKKGALV